MVVAQCPVGLHGDLGAEQVGGGALELEHVEQVAVAGDVAAEPPEGGERQVGDPYRAASLTSSAACERTCCSVAGGSASGWLTA